jgi:hypothetical protein
MHTVMPWTEDPQVVAARALVTSAEEKEARLDQEYKQLWHEAVSTFVEGSTQCLPEPSDPCWQARRLAARAGRETREARRALEAVEMRAQEKTAPAGYRRGRDKMEQGVRGVFTPLAQWLSEYDQVRAEVLEETAVKLPNLGHLYLSAHGVQDFVDTIFLQNRFGDSLLCEQHRHE